ncbi:MAG: hemerythrin domain-containing protein [Methylococcaceae bacterium]|nr:hemerythrin domain-containing protein [Methylococcaceae bacterium]
MEFKFTDPATDFSNGLLVISDYHHDFLARGLQLVELAKEIKKQGMTEQLANQCMEMYCHYSHATHLHHKDEEEVLFPLLVDQSSLIIGMIERLIMDHEEIEESWATLSTRLSQPEKITNFDHFLHITLAFEKILREHLTREDEDFSPQIKKILAAEQIKQAGKKMSELRHLAS